MSPLTLKGKPLKIAVIGGGSTYTPELVDGLIRRAAQLPVAELWLVDVPAGERKQEVVGGLVKRMASRAGLPTRVELTLDRRRAIAGADFVINQFRVGQLAARAKDEHIPLKYGIIGQETTGPGGFAKALRTIPVALDVARDAEELAPDAWIINFTNPSGIVTEALIKHSRMKCIGLCNVPLTMQMAVASLLGVDPTRLRFEFIGLNHLSWIKRIALDGQDITRSVIAAAAEHEQVMEGIPDRELVAELLNDLGLLPSPYLRYFYFPDVMLADEQARVAAGDGTRANQVLRVEERLLALYQDPGLTEKPAELSQRGGAYYSEAALSAIAAIVANRPEVHVVNVPNRGALADLPPDAVVETNCLIDGTGATPLAAGPLPLSVRGLVQQVKAYEQMTIEAAITGDRRRAVLALAANPLVPGVRVAAALVEELLAAHAEHLPQFWPRA